MAVELQVEERNTSVVLWLLFVIREEEYSEQLVATLIL
jgi:hypothetical protein